MRISGFTIDITDKMLSKVFILLTSLTVTLGLLNGPVVKTNSGRIRGMVDHSTSGRPFHRYRGIPYAQAPVGEFRFKPPRKYGQWNGIWDGTQLGPLCPQIRFADLKYDGDEDCLVLNVYVPEYPGWPHRRLPVLFSIHGGGFVSGSGRYDDFGPQNHMDYDVVLVVINYRLGIFGNLGTNDSNAYGNNAMLDQVMALQWVHDNIEYFGGDPDQVTIVGESAGGVSVSYHMLSDLSKGLFSKAIAQSGVTTMFFQNDSLTNAKNFARNFNCSVETSAEIVECLGRQSAENITLATALLLPVIWCPTAEPPGGPGFLTENPLTLLESGRIASKVPLIIGHNDMEGYLFYIILKPTFLFSGSAYFDIQFPFELPLFTNVQPFMTDAIEAIKEHYYNNNTDLDNPTIFTEVFSRISGDRFFDVQIDRNAELLSEAGVPVYAYIYNYIGQFCFVSFIGGQCGLYSSHADELHLQFRFSSPTQPLNTNDAKMSKILNSLWVEFAARPLVRLDNGQKWPLFIKSDPSYVLLNLSPAIKEGPLSNQTEFWLDTIDGMVQQDS